jgi:phosphatidate cytidylyltransferase
MQALMFREVVRINTHRVRRARASSSTSAASAAAAAQSSKSFGGDRSLRFFNYYLLLTTIYFMYGKLLYARIPQAHPLKDAHTFVSFMMLMGGFVGFVLSLRKNDLKMQFRQFGLTVLSLFFVVVLASTIVHNIMEGMFWFVFPAALIVVNDISAYLFGFFFGRTPLIALSPKKTWEGFLGATFTTIAVAYLAAPFVAAWFPSFQCRHVDLFSNECATTLSPAFDSKEVLQKHALVLGAFAATIAPFGGFFASGFKRAFGVKDFGDTIPGHGGITDRMDCQTLMGVFVYVYYSTFLQVRAPVSAEKLFDQAMHLSLEQQRMLYSMLGSVLG